MSACLFRPHALCSTPNVKAHLTNHARLTPDRRARPLASLWRAGVPGRLEAPGAPRGGRCRVAAGALAACVWLATLDAGAMANPDGSFTNAPPPEGSIRERVDTAHGHLSDYVDAAGGVLDSLLTRTFGGGPPDTNEVVDLLAPTPLIPDGNGGSRVMLAPAIAYSERDGLQYRGRFFARVDLPRFKDRVQVIALNIQEDEDVLREFTDPISRERRVRGDNDKAAGVRFVLFQDMRFDLSAAAGLRFTAIEPVPKLRLRGRVKYDVGKMRYALAETGFWQRDDGFGEKTEFSIARQLTSRFGVRNTGAALLKENVPGVELGETLDFRYAIHPRQSVGLKLGVQWQTRPKAVVDSYSIRLPFRQGLWRQWLYLQIEPGADFPNEDGYDIAPLISVGLEVAFGNPRHR
ncbi:MAG: hypothetical protein K8T26_16280 [Lentisphaerae bacterium]|nr:hypothetical protein [Lentisphaerota bacterium]